MSETVQHSEKFEIVKYYYETRFWSKMRVRRAVTTPKSAPWITADEYKEITGEDYE